jgi:chromosome partitioning protein
MKTLSVLSRKGGSGKTTVSISLAIAAQQAGLKVVLADADPLRSVSVVLAERAEGSSFLVEVKPGKLKALKDACRRAGCDLLIIDTPTTPEPDVMKAVGISDFCLAVARPTALDIAAIEKTVELVARSRTPGMIVLNQCPPARSGAEPTLTRSAMDRLEFSKLPLAWTKLRTRAAYQHAFAQGRSVTEWNPSSDAASDVLRLLAEISDELMPHPARVAEAQWRRSVIGDNLARQSHAPLPDQSQPLEEAWPFAMLGLTGPTMGDFLV